MSSKPAIDAESQAKLQFLEGFEKLFDSATHSDLTVCTGSSARFHAHQNILSLRTDFFSNAIKDGFKEAQDGNTVTIKEHSSHAVWRFLKYCYSGDYPTQSNSFALSEEDDIGVLKHLRVYMLADMLGVDTLKTLAAEKAKEAFEKNWVQADFSHIVREVFSNTFPSDNQIRDLIVKMAHKHLEELETDQGFKDVLMEFGEFSGSVILSGISLTSECRHCENSQVYCKNCGNYPF